MKGNALNVKRWFHLGHNKIVQVRLEESILQSSIEAECPEAKTKISALSANILPCTDSGWRSDWSPWSACTVTCYNI